MKINLDILKNSRNTLDKWKIMIILILNYRGDLEHGNI